jgi:hypothetical protein
LLQVSLLQDLCAALVDLPETVSTSGTHDRARSSVRRICSVLRLLFALPFFCRQSNMSLSGPNDLPATVTAPICQELFTDVRLARESRRTGAILDEEGGKPSEWPRLFYLTEGRGHSEGLLRSLSWGRCGLLVGVLCSIFLGNPAHVLPRTMVPGLHVDLLRNKTPSRV